MFDGRESTAITGTTKILYSNYPSSLQSDLAHQSLDATTGHAQGDGTRPTPAEQQQIVNFEMALSTAQIIDNYAGRLDAHGATGGPVPLTTRPFFISINSSVHPLVPTLEQPGGLTPGDGHLPPRSLILLTLGRRCLPRPHGRRLRADRPFSIPSPST